MSAACHTLSIVGRGFLAAGRPAGAILLGSLFVAVAASPLRAQSASETSSEAQTLANEYVARFVAQARSEAQRELLQEEDQRVQDADVNQTFPDYTKLNDGLRQQLDKSISEELGKIESQAKQQAGDLDRETDRLAKQWTETRGQRNQAHLEAAEASTSRQAAMRLAYLFSLDSRWLWLAGLIVAGMFAGLVWHQNRRELRRYLHGYRQQHVGLPIAMGVSLVVLALATLVTFFFGGAIYRAVLSGGQDDGQDSSLHKLEKEVADLTPAPHGEDPAADGEKPDPAPPGDLGKIMQDRYSGEHAADKALLEPWRNMRSRLLAAAVAAKVKEKVALAMQQDAEELGKLTASVTSSKSAVAKSQTVKQRIRFATGSGLILLTLAGSIVFVRRVRKRKEEVSKVCPMCLAEGTLKPDEHGSFGPLSSVTCSNVIDGAHYQECGFSFLATYQTKEKLYIPTLGHPSSGKTLWSAMVYRELIRGNFDESIEFQKIRSRSGEDFDRLVEDIIIDRVGPAATQVAELPHPLIFDFKDRDRWGRSNVLLSIFDYSGEVMQRMSLDQPQRRRALIADAYLVFCDPTQASEPQAKEFVDFAADVQALRQSATTRADRAKLGRQHTPVAICVPKIDLLVNIQSSDVGDISGEVQRFYDDLSEIDATHPAMSLARLRARSDLVVRTWDYIWPGWRVESQVRNTFGGRYMFFPLTPVGLGELGQTDLRDRILQPYGILEPLCWLLHMNGYPVLH